MSKIDDYINHKLEEKIYEYVKDAVNRGLSKKEISSYLIYKGHDKEVVEKILGEIKIKKTKKLNFFKKKKSTAVIKSDEKEGKQIGKKSKIAIAMVVVFILAMVFVPLIKAPKSGEGTCPLVTDNDMKTIAYLSYESSNEFSYAEMDQLVGSYLGKDDCTLINKNTIKRLRKIKLNP